MMATIGQNINIQLLDIYAEKPVVIARERIGIAAVQEKSGFPHWNDAQSARASKRQQGVLHDARIENQPMGLIDPAHPAGSGAGLRGGIRLEPRPPAGQ
ncbi:hypothetical protein D9M71_557050 [compost metagenome]